MTKDAHIAVVGIEVEEPIITDILRNCDAAVECVDTLDEALSWVEGRSNALLIVNLKTDDLDPLDVVAEAYKKQGERPAPFLFVSDDNEPEVVVVCQSSTTGEFTVDRPTVAQIEGLASKVLTPTEAAFRMGDVPSMAERLEEIGFNDSLERDGGRLSIQTEVRREGDVITVRRLVFEGGRIVRSDTFPVELGRDDPVAEVEAFAERLHRDIKSDFEEKDR